LFRGGYKERDTYQLFSLGQNRKVNLVTKVEFRNQNGSKLAASRVVGRGDALHLISDGFLYRADVETAVAR
jgi:hypothetical protein